MLITWFLSLILAASGKCPGVHMAATPNPGQDQHEHGGYPGFSGTQHFARRQGSAVPTCLWIGV